MVRGTLLLEVRGKDDMDEAVLCGLPSKFMSSPYVLLRACAIHCKPVGALGLNVDLAQIGRPMFAPIMLTFYALRHTATGQLMPQMKRGRGYTHWNPGKPDADPLYSVTNVPRLLISTKQARRCQQHWSHFPNAEMIRYERSAYGDEGGGEDFKTKPDGRKIDDLEIVTIHVVIEQG